MIDEILVDALNSAYWHGELKNKDGVLAPVLKEALTAIYEIGLECIGQEIDNYTGTDMEDWQKGYNAAKDEIRLAWAKACGVAEK